MHHMPLAYSTEPSLLPIERPRCPKCTGRMMLARIEPGPANSDLRTFECPKCEHVEKRLIQDPLNSVKQGWQNSGLKAPE
jgi:exosome complex RNA-binding protein Csl4